MSHFKEIEGPPAIDDLEDQFRGLIWDDKPNEALALAEHVMHALMSKNSPDEEYRSYAWEKREQRFYEWRGCWLTMMSVCGIAESHARRARERKEEQKRTAKDRAFARSLGLTVTTRKRKTMTR